VGAKLFGLALCLGALAAAVAVLANWLLTAPRFALAAVEVRGTSRLSEEEILAAAGIRPGENFFSVHPEQVVFRLTAIPLVRHAHVIRAFPNRVTLVVEERRPFTLVHAGRLYWMDEEGVPLVQEPQAVVPDLPVISGLTPEELFSAAGNPSGGWVAPSDRTLAAVALLRSLLRSGSELRREISEIDVSRAEGLVLYTVDGVEVRLGNDWREEQLARLEGVLAEVALRKEPVASIDLRFKDLVVFTPRAR
jgi:cell division septal protein FtsQ